MIACKGFIFDLVDALAQAERKASHVPAGETGFEK